MYGSIHAAHAHIDDLRRTAARERMTAELRRTSRVALLRERLASVQAARRSHDGSDLAPRPVSVPATRHG